jgi:hypothetical protein
MENLFIDVDIELVLRYGCSSLGRTASSVGAEPKAEVG